MKDQMDKRTVINLDLLERVVPRAMTTMYGRNVVRNRITVDTLPMLAEEKNVDPM